MFYSKTPDKDISQELWNKEKCSLKGLWEQQLKQIAADVDSA